MEFNDVKNPRQLYEFMRENIKYGFISSYDMLVYSRKEIRNSELYEQLLFNSYFLQSPDSVLKSKYGLCYDQVEFARSWFSYNNYLVKTYFTKYHNHSFLVYYDNNSYNLFETTFKGSNGIYPFDNMEEVFDKYIEMQLSCAKSDINDDINIIEYSKPLYGQNFYQFRDYILTNPVVYSKRIN